MSETGHHEIVFCFFGTFWDDAKKLMIIWGDFANTDLDNDMASPGVHAATEVQLVDLDILPLPSFKLFISKIFKSTLVFSGARVYLRHFTETRN